MDKNWSDNTKLGEDGGTTASGFEFDVDPNEDPELALALQLSMEEHRQEQQQEEESSIAQELAFGASPRSSTQVQPSTPACATSAPKSEGGNSTTTRTETGGNSPNEFIVDRSSMTEEEEIAWASAIKLFTQSFKPNEEESDVNSSEDLELLLPTSEVSRKDKALKELEEAVCGGHVAAVEQALALGANPHIPRVDVDDQCLSLLTAAALYGHTEVVKVLMVAGVSVEGPGEPHPTALHVAAAKGHSDIVTILLEARANQEARTDDGSTALILAARNGQTACVQQLLDAGADINATTSHGCTSLHIASEGGIVDVVKTLLDAGANFNAKDNDGDTPLLCAALCGHVDIVKGLLSAGANISDKSSTGNISLHYASAFDHVDTVKLLVKAGAHKTALNNVNCTPMDVAARSGSCEVVEYFVGEHGTGSEEDDDELTASLLAQWRGDAPTCWLLGKHEGRLLNPDDNSDLGLMKAVYEGDMTAVKRSLALGANPHITWLASNTDDQYLSLLTAAALYGHLEVVRLLMAAGVRLEGPPGELDPTALHSAALGGHSDIVRILLEAGANLEARTNNGNTALYLAAQNGHTTCVHQLLHAGADVNATNYEKKTPLHAAAWDGHVEVLEELLEAGTDAKAKNNDGDTPLHVAAYNGHVDTVKKLLGADANLNDKNNDKRTPLHLAAYGGHTDAVQELVEAGARINDKDGTEHTSLHYAAFGGHVDAMKVLVKAGGDIRIPGSNNMTPLDIAACFGGHEIMKCFAGEETVEGLTATAIAKVMGDTETSWCKNKNPVRLSNPDSCINLPLKEAVCEGDVAAVKQALALGADTQITWQLSDDVRLSLLTAAAYYGHIEIMRLLIAVGLSLEGPGNHQPTALHMAAFQGHSDMVTFLLDAGANLEARIEQGNTALHLAAQNNHVTSLRLLLNSGADINAANISGLTPLSLVAWNGNVDSLKELLEAGANTTYKDSAGKTPLDQAARKGHVDAVKELLKAGANITDTDNDGRTPLHSAACDGHADVVKELLDAGAQITDKDNDGMTPLLCAACNGHVDALKELLDAGANITDKDNNGRTPLHCAAWDGHTDVVKKLIEVGIDIRDKNNDKDTPIHMAAYNDHVDVVNELLKAGAYVSDQNNDRRTPLHLAAYKGHVATVKKLLEAGANISDKEGDERTSLHCAAGGGHAHLVKELLEAGADISEKDKLGYTPLHLAARNGHVDALKTLLEAGSDISGKDRNGNTALHLAAWNCHVDIVQELLKAGVSINTENAEEITALHWAASSGHVDTIKKLLEAGANISVRSNIGKAPLHEAAWNGHTDAVKELLKAGANINGKDNNEETILHWAAFSGRVNVVKVLLEAGATVSDKDKYGNTPLHLAARYGHADAVKELVKAGTNVNVKRNDERIPLHLAALNGNVDTIKYLLKVGSNINEKDIDGGTSLHLAAHKGCADAMKVLLEDGAHISEQDNSGTTPLHMAVQSGQIDAVKVLGKAAAGDMSVRVNSKMTPLNYAVALSGREMVEFLMEYYGCNPEEDSIGLTGTGLAEVIGDANTLWWLKKRHGDLSNPDSSSKEQKHDWNFIEKEVGMVREYRETGRMDELLLMIPQYTDGHLQDDEGMTILHWAAKLGHYLLVNSLINDCGMYPFVKTYNGETPADLAQQQGHTHVIRVLNNMDPPKIEGTKEELYEKLLELICSTDDVKQARDLLWVGAPLSPIGRVATEALTLAMEWNRSRILTLLVAAGAPLTISTSSLSILNKTFRNPDITARTRAFIHRAYFHKLQCEKQYVTDHKELGAGVERILKKLVKHKDCSKSSRAHWPSSDNKNLSKLLTEATRRNCPLICSLLYQAGGKTFLGQGDESPITAAIENQHWETMKVLVCNMGAYPYVYNSKGDLSLLKMPKSLQYEIEQIIYDKERRKLEYFYESRRNDSEKETARMLLNLQEDLFSRYRSDRDKYTRKLEPSQPVTASGDTNIPLLLETRITSLSIATKRGLPQLIFLLVKVGGTNVDTVIDTTMGTTSLHQAVSSGKGECVGILLSLGSDCSRPDHYGHSALHLAAMFGHMDVYQCLLQHNEYKNCSITTGINPDDVCSGFEHYLRSYEKCGQRSVENEDVNLCTDSREAIEKLLNCLDWEQLLNEPERIRMDFTKGEAKVVKDVVLNELRIMCNAVEEASNIFRGELRLGGSSSDGTKLYSPDEVDVNLVLDRNLLTSIEVVDQEDQELYNSGHKKVFEVKTDNPYLEGDNLMNEFHDLIQKYLDVHRLTDNRLSLVPPGVAKTQVGVALHLAWQGKEYPLVLIGVDLVPVVEVPWIEELSRPFLTPPGRDTFHISNTSDGFWRGSFAGVEAAVLRQLDPQELKAYLICKILLSCMKPEPWMSAKKKTLYTWWGRRDWRISMPPTFALKNAFFRCLERKRKCNMEWPEEKLLHWVSQVFGEMCRDFDPLSTNLECREHTKIRPYFAEDFQQPKNGVGAPEIVRYLSKMIQERKEGGEV